LQAQQRRLEDARKAEERRQAEKAHQEELARREEEKKKAQISARDARMKEIQRRFDSLRQTGGVLLTGYVSVQPGSTIVWRRRYFQLQRDSMLFFKNSEVFPCTLPFIGEHTEPMLAGNSKINRLFQFSWISFWG
jgi:hypothetical protein